MNAVDQIIDDLKTVIASFENRDYSHQVTKDTRFFADLGFVSIDAVVLGERLEHFYGRTLPFAQFLSGLAERQVSDIEVGELAEFVAECLNKNPEA